MTLSQRMMDCECGLKMDRDLNAAINIDKAGFALRGELATAPNHLLTA